MVPAKNFEQVEPVRADLTVPGASVVPAKFYVAPESAQPELPVLTAVVKQPKVNSILQQPLDVQIEQPPVVKQPKVSPIPQRPLDVQIEQPVVKQPKVSPIPQQPLDVQIEQPPVVKLPKSDFQLGSCTITPHPKMKNICVPDVSVDEIVRKLLSYSE